MPSQWHLASYAHLVGEHLGLLHEHSNSRKGFFASVNVLMRSVLFDISLTIDAYEMHLLQEIQEQVDRPMVEAPQ